MLRSTMEHVRGSATEFLTNGDGDMVPLNREPNNHVVAYFVTIERAELLAATDPEDWPFVDPWCARCHRVLYFKQEA